MMMMVYEFHFIQPVLAAPGVAAAAASSSFEAVACSEVDVLESSCKPTKLKLKAVKLS